MSPPPGGSSVRRLVGTFGGVGFLPGAPGTWGSLATVLLVMALLGTAGLDGLLGAGLIGDGLRSQLSAHEDGGQSVVVLVTIALIVVITLVGTAVGQHARADFGKGDPGAFVLDEVAGQLIPLLPLLPGPLDPLGVAVAFGAFRIFDVIKPPPVRQLERLPGGVGIMADDLAAGLFALIPVLFLA